MTASKDIAANTKPRRPILAGIIASMAAGFSVGLGAAMIVVALTVGFDLSDWSAWPFVFALVCIVFSMLGTVISAILGHVIVALTGSDKEHRLRIGVQGGGVVGALIFVAMGGYTAFEILDHYGSRYPISKIFATMLGALIGAVAGGVFFFVRRKLLPDDNDLATETPVNDLRLP